MSRINQTIGYIDYSKLEKFIEIIERFNKMSEDEKDFISKFLK